MPVQANGVATDGQQWIAVGDSGVYRSVDDGLDWSAGTHFWRLYLGANKPFELDMKNMILKAGHGIDFYTDVQAAVSILGEE